MEVRSSEGLAIGQDDLGLIGLVILEITVADKVKEPETSDTQQLLDLFERRYCGADVDAAVMRLSKVGDQSLLSSRKGQAVGVR